MRIAPSAFAILAVVCVLLASISLMPLASADDAPSGKVPVPQISENHVFDQSESNDGNERSNFDNEAWGIGMQQGDVNLGISARNYTNGDRVTVDFGINFVFTLENKSYIAMFTIDQVLFVVGNDSLLVPLRNCASFELSRTNVAYDGNVPTFDTVVVFKDVRVRMDDPSSAFDLTLIAHVRCDWNNTDIKVEAMLDLAGTELGTYAPGTEYTAEVHYIMQLTDPVLDLGPPDYNTIKPSRYTNDSLEYNLTRDDGTPYALSKLNMNNAFTITSASGIREAMGYSRIDSPNATNGGQSYNHNARVVTHGFPGLVYGDTQSMRSDPEILVYHDIAADGNSGGALIGPPTLLIVIALVAVAGCVAAFLLIRRRKRTAGKK